MCPSVCARACGPSPVAEASAAADGVLLQRPQPLRPRAADRVTGIRVRVTGIRIRVTGIRVRVGECVVSICYSELVYA